MRRPLTLALLVLAGCVSTKPPELVPRTVAYRCADGSGLSVRLADRESVTIDGTVLPHAPTASGVRYSDGTTTFWEKGGQATFTSPGISRVCRPIADPAWLPGTRWRLLRIESSDDTVLNPAEPDRYTLEFGAGGELSGQADCNRIRGRWAADGASMVLGPFASTRAACPPESIADRYVRALESTATWMRVEGGGIALALKVDGGIVRLEPLPR